MLLDIAVKMFWQKYKHTYVEQQMKMVEISRVHIILHLVDLKASKYILKGALGMKELNTHVYAGIVCQ